MSLDNYCKSTSVVKLVEDYKFIIFSMKVITRVTSQLSDMKRPNWYSISQNEERANLVCYRNKTINLLYDFISDMGYPVPKKQRDLQENIEKYIDYMMFFYPVYSEKLVDEKRKRA